MKYEETIATKKKREEKEERASSRYWEQARRRSEKEDARLDAAGYRRGQDAGRGIGLDAQMDEKVKRRIGQ